MDMINKPPRASGDMDEIIAKYKNTVYGLALIKTGSRPDAEDVFQEVFLAYFKRNKSFNDEEHRKAWLLKTTVNMCRRVTLSPWRKRMLPMPEEPPEEGAEFALPEENAIWQAVMSLKEEYRLPIYLFYFQGETTSDIAKALGIGQGAVRMRLSRGREMLREELKGEYFNE